MLWVGGRVCYMSGAVLLSIKMISEENSIPEITSTLKRGGNIPEEKAHIIISTVHEAKAGNGITSGCVMTSEACLLQTPPSHLTSP